MDLIWLWLGLAVLGVVIFAVAETYAIKTRRATLSLSIWRLYQAWPLSGVIFGMIVGGLAVHFFWHWCPPGSVSSG